MPSRFWLTEAQLNAYAEIVALLDERGKAARIVVEEQSNTLEHIRHFAEAKAAHLA
ncbi:hypothetical protein AAE026_31520 [Bradyrhizobium sp. DN5]